jgi:hypothetical protein
MDRLRNTKQQLGVTRSVSDLGSCEESAVRMEGI